MGITKSELFEERQNKLATLAKVIGHPARVAILEYLLKNQSCICNDLVNELPLSQSTITQHLKELKQIGLIKGEIDGPKINYCINEESWQEAKSIMTAFFSQSAARNNCC